MRQADVLSTQLGIRPPKKIKGNEDEIDEDSLVYAQDANWYVGNADVETIEMANGIYNQLPTRMQMYQSSLNKLIPMGDVSVSAEAGDPLQSKTPAGVKMAQANLSIDDEDFKDNLNITFEAVAKNLINLTFANMQGVDLMKLTDDERERLASAGLEFPVDAEGNPSNELEIIWDEARATFDFEVDAEEDKTTDDQQRLESLLKIVELRATDPTIEQTLFQSGYKLNLGELFSSIIKLTTDNDKILEEVSAEELDMANQEMLAQEQMAQEQAQGQMEQPEGELTPEQAQINLEAVMQEYGIDEDTAAEMLDAEYAGVPQEQIVAALNQAQGELNA
jgi:hypothetical protein